jgi:glycosyltransferase involved in cell wall biosynthesis
METDRFLTAAPDQTRQAVCARLGLSPADFVVGTVARLAELKGHDDLLDALADDLRNNPNWKLLWVGDGWRRDRLLSTARTLGLTIAELDRGSASPPHLLASSPTPSTYHSPLTTHAQLLLTGLLPPDAVPGCIRAMDVLAHPSYREGLPRTVPQALLCGVCPVAYDVDGTGEVFRDGQTGRLIAPGDRAGLRAAIEQLAADPALRAAMAARGRDECRDRFSAERMVADLETVYHRSLELAAHPPPRP